jgi:hypothetical protein
VWAVLKKPHYRTRRICDALNSGLATRLGAEILVGSSFERGKALESEEVSVRARPVIRPWACRWLTGDIPGVAVVSARRRPGTFVAVVKGFQTKGLLTS